MKKLTLIIALVLLSSCELNNNKESDKTDLTEKPVNNALKAVVNTLQKPIVTEVEKMQIRAQDRAQKARMVKVWIRRHDVKTCMKILQIKEMNNEVVECNTDRFVTLRNDEVEAYREKYKQVERAKE